MIKDIRKMHLINAEGQYHGRVLFYPTYCGQFFDSAICTGVPERVTCKSCRRLYNHHCMMPLKELAK